MRPIHLAKLDKMRPVVVLTRENVRPFLSKIVIAPITSRIRNLSTEVPVGPGNGIDHSAVVNCDSITTILSGDLGTHIGYLLPHQEAELSLAIAAAFELEPITDE